MNLRWILLLVLSVFAGCVSAQKQDQAASRALLGQAYLRESNPAGAVLILEEAVQLDRYNFEAWQNLALAYMSQGVFEDSERAFKKALQLAPGRAEINNNYGLLLLKLDRREESIASFEAAIADITYRSPALAMSNLGYVFYLDGRNDEALAHLTEALRRAPGLCQAQFNRGLVYRASGEADLALADFQQTIDTCGDTASGAYLQAAEVMLEQGDVYGGCVYLDRLATIDPHSPLGRDAREVRARSCQR